MHDTEGPLPASWTSGIQGLLEAQRRGFQVFLEANRVLGEGIRRCSEHQFAILRLWAQSGMENLRGFGERGWTPETADAQLERFRSLADETAAEMRALSEATMELNGELSRLMTQLLSPPAGSPQAPGESSPSRAVRRRTEAETAKEVAGTEEARRSRAAG